MASIRTRFAVGVVSAAVGLGATFGAAGASTPATRTGKAPRSVKRAATSVSVTATEFSFRVDHGTVTAGIVPLHLRNRGTVPHELVVARLHDGVTAAGFVDRFRADPNGSMQLVDFAGGVNAIEPRARATGYANLQPGHYVLLCYLPLEDGSTHLHHGMIAPLTVVAGTARPEPPATVADVELRDYSIGLPAGGLGVAGSYRFTNSGTEPHEMAVLRIDGGRSLGDVVRYLQSGMHGDRPFTTMGGSGIVAPGHVGYAALALPAGHYVAMCFVAGRQTGAPHAAMGMVATFDVT